MTGLEDFVVRPDRPYAIHKVVHESRRIENIALVGFMGTGKSAVGHALAHLLQFQMVDTDDLIERRAGKSITEIFRSEGEARFREYEREIVAELGNLRRAVIATGGGLIVNPDNLANLRNHSLLVCLWASPETIWQRVRHQSHRPLLEDPDPLGKIRRLVAERAPFYRQADVLVNTGLRSVREVTQQVAHQFHLFQEPDRRERPDSTPGA